jgi:hypothetical protein
MRFSTFALSILGVAALGAVGWICWRATEDQRAWRELLSYAEGGSAASKKGQQGRLDELLQRRLGYGKNNDSFTQAWSVLPLESLQRVVVFETPSSVAIPSEFEVIGHVFSAEGVHLSQEAFSGGWRMMWASVRIRSVSGVAPQIIEVTSDNSLGGADVARQYFAVLRDRLVLVRLEDGAGKGCRNHYGAPNWTIGPRPPLTSPETWEQSLASSDPVEVLRALAWIGGTHLDPSATSRREARHEDPVEAALCIEVRNRPAVLSRIRDLAKSPTVWLKEAALLAASPEWYR